jgi:two-component system, cell cycle sensor histidine kinase and response regulator CckA
MRAAPGLPFQQLMPENREVLSRYATILLVDDSPRIRPLIRQILDQVGCSVLEADNPQKALELAEEYAGAIDLLLTDVIMPGMTGIELAAQIRAQRPEIKVLCMSGYSFQAEIPSEISFIEKPFRPDELLTRIGNLLGQRG